MALVEISRNELSSKPARQIVLLVATFPDGSSTRGTGVLVGPNDILTAGHIVYRQNQGWMEQLDLYFAADFNPTTGRLQARGESIPWSQWTVSAWPNQIYASAPAYSSTPQETQFDVAMIGIDYPVGTELGYLNLNEGFNQTGVPFDATAYGYSSGFSALTRAETTAIKYGPSASMYTIPEQLFAGASGGPLLTSDNEVIGVVSAGSAESGTQFADISRVWNELLEVYHQNDALLPTWSEPSWNLKIFEYGQERLPAQITEGETLLITVRDSHQVADRIFIQVTGITADDLKDSNVRSSGLLSGSMEFGSEFTTALTLSSDDGYEGIERAEIIATFYDDDSGHQKTISSSVNILDDPLTTTAARQKFPAQSADYDAAVLIETAFGDNWIDEYLAAGISLLERHDTLGSAIDELVSSQLIESYAGSAHAEWVAHIYGNITPPLSYLQPVETYTQLLDTGLTTKSELLMLSVQGLKNWDLYTEGV